MTIEIPEIDIDTASLEELKSHVALCARAENGLRAHHISVQLRIISLQHVDALPLESKKRAVKSAGKMRDRRADYDFGEEFSIDDFR